jgi:hypothetical protein
VQGANRTFLAVAIGFGMGLCIGPMSVLAINARNVLRSNEEWPEWSPVYLLALLITSIPSAINGALGAGLTARGGGLGWRPVTILPAVLHLVVGVGALVAEPQSVLGFQWYTLVFTAVIWSAGRIGQRVGRAFCPVVRGQEPSPAGPVAAPDPAPKTGPGW